MENNSSICACEKIKAAILGVSTNRPLQKNLILNAFRGGLGPRTETVAIPKGWSSAATLSTIKLFPPFPSCEEIAKKSIRT
jgi:hypothetical protein